MTPLFTGLDKFVPARTLPPATKPSLGNNAENKSLEVTFKPIPELCINNDHIFWGNTGPDWEIATKPHGEKGPDHRNMNVYFKLRQGNTCTFFVASGAELSGDGFHVPYKAPWIAPFHNDVEIRTEAKRVYMHTFPHLIDGEGKLIGSSETDSNTETGQRNESTGANVTTDEPDNPKVNLKRPRNIAFLKLGPRANTMTTEEAEAKLRDFSIELTDDLARRISMAMFRDGVGLKELPGKDVLEDIRVMLKKGRKMLEAPLLNIFLRKTGQQPHMMQKTALELYSEYTTSIRIGNPLPRNHPYHFDVFDNPKMQEIVQRHKRLFGV